MRSRRGDEPETYYLTCPVCGALAGTSCIENYQERNRVHPSRKLSISERNRRAADGWEPPELTERRLGERGADGAGAMQSRFGGLLADRSAAEPRRPPGGAPRPALSASALSCDENPPAQWAGIPTLGVYESARAWFAAFLGGFPEYATVPRWQLRDAASAWWPGAEESPRPLAPARQLRLPGSGRGRRSSHQLADQLRTFEGLGLIKRDHVRDVVIVTNPAGLRRLAEARPELPCSQEPGPGGDGH